MDEERRELGFIDYALIEFPENRFNGEISPAILDLVSRGVISILDLVFIKKDQDGSITGLEITDMDEDEIGGLRVFAEDASGLLSEDDVVAAAEVLEPNTAAMFVVWENKWAIPLAGSIRRAGGVVASSGRIPLEHLAEVLDEPE